MPYVHAIRAGTGFAFHVETALATVYLQRRAGRWELAEVKGRLNAPAPAWLVAELQRWLGEVQAPE